MGWNRDRAVEGEAVILQAMVNSFRTSKILFTDGSPNGSESSDPAPDDTAFQTDLQLASNGGASWLSLNTDGMAVGGHDPKDSAPTVLLDTCDYKEYDPSESSPSGSAVPPGGGNPLLQFQDYGHFHRSLQKLFQNPSTSVWKDHAGADYTPSCLFPQQLIYQSAPSI